LIKIGIVDGKGGGLGRSIVSNLVEAKISNIEIIALGTNAFATQAMLKAGAHNGATGENAIAHMAERVDLIIGPLAIIHSGSMMGEISAKIANSISESKAEKILMPTSQCGIHIVDVKGSSLKILFLEIVEQVKKMI